MTGLAKNSRPNFEVKSRLFRVLVVDDCLDNRILAAAILKKSACQVWEASSGQDAISLATSSEFDLILMDLQMPELDGFSTVEQMRRLGVSCSIWALSAYNIEGIAARCLSSGFNFFMPKPLSPLKLEDTIASEFAGTHS